MTLIEKNLRECTERLRKLIERQREYFRRLFGHD